MSKNVKKVLSGCVAVSIALVAIIIAVSFNAVKSNAKQISGEGSESTYTDQDGTVYVAAFLKDTTENSITVDVIELVTSDNAERVNELGLTEEDMPDGYYIHNPKQETVMWKLNEQTVYTFIDWDGDFTGSDYPEEYTTTDIEEFHRYIETYDDAAPGMPFFFQVEDGVVKMVLEKFFA